MSAWLIHLKQFYATEKKKNSNYTYKRAMKDAAKTYRKVNATKVGPKRSTRKRRGRV